MKKEAKFTPEMFEILLYLSRLSSDDEKIDTLSSQVAQTIEFFDLLKQYDTGNTEARPDSIHKETELRTDEIVKSIDQPDLKKMSDEYMDGYFRVPKVLGTGA